MDRDQLRATVLGFLGTFAVVGLLLYLVGVDDLVDQLSSADPVAVSLIVLVIFAWLAFWGMALKTVLGVLGVEIPAVRAFFVFSGAMFANNITPFGQAGGEPVAALLISRVADAEYENGLAAIASVDTLNFVPSISLAILGVGYLTVETTLGRRLEFVTAAVVVLAMAVPVIVYLGWRHRYGLEHRAVRWVTPTLRRIAEFVPRVTAPSAESLERRVKGFFEAIERVATDREGLALALSFSTLGWGCQMLGLWLAFQAIGVPISPALAVFVVPIGAIAGATPLPGGAGAIEAVLASLLAVATGPAVTLQVATAAVILFRGIVYWLPTIIGGIVVGTVGVNGR